MELISNPVLTGFTAPKIIWLRNHEPEIYAKVKKVLLPKDYVRLMLTGEYATEVSDASGTALFNVSKRAWADEMLDAIDIPRDWMPACYESPEVSGKITPEAAALTGSGGRNAGRGRRAAIRRRARSATALWKPALSVPRSARRASSSRSAIRRL